MTVNDKEPEVVLYDLACTENTCFSPVVWRIRLMLNYKNVPYRTVFLEFPDIEPTMKEMNIHPPVAGAKYTVPVIQHIPTGTAIMDSKPIEEFLEATYPTPAVTLSSELGDRVQAQARASMGSLYKTNLMARELDILSPRSREYYRRTREAALGRPLETFLLDPSAEAEAWEAMKPDVQAVGELLRSNAAEGPFILGAQPCVADLWLVGSLMTAKVVHPPMLERILAVEDFRRVFEACAPWTTRSDH